MKNNLAYVTIYYCGKTKPLFRCSRRWKPHPQMQDRNEFNLHIFGHRIAITWGAY